ncbi:MAG: hypothetical protein HYX75_13255 [Acidobacteria bacterium]|nr:hypothetical protein [Acidobacteriota bacterium]
MSRARSGKFLQSKKIDFVGHKTDCRTFIHYELERLPAVQTDRLKRAVRVYKSYKWEDDKWLGRWIEDAAKSVGWGGPRE